MLWNPPFRLYTAAMQPRTLANTVDEARAFLARGNLPVADIVCRAVLGREPQNAAAWAVLAAVAAELGLPGHVLEYASRALELGHAGSDTRALRERAAAMPSRPPANAAGERFLLAKAWGYGFFSDVDQTLGLLLAAEFSGRTPVIHWGANSLFGGSEERSAFTDFFEPVSALSVHDLLGRGYDFYPDKWRDDNLRQERINRYNGPGSRTSAVQLLSRPEQVVVGDFHTGVVTLLPWAPADHPLHGKSVEEAYQYLIDRFLRVRRDIREEIDAFAATHFTRRPIIAAHARGSDKYLEDPQLEMKINAYPQVINHLAQGRADTSIFLITDSSTVRDAFAQLYGSRLITTESTRTATREGLHYQPHEDRRRLGVEVLKDVYLAAQCDAFLGMGSSNVSCMVHHLRTLPPGREAIIPPLLTHTPNPYIYMSAEEQEPLFGPAAAERLRNRL
jgi:protein O-GlcNAc transferase